MTAKQKLETLERAWEAADHGDWSTVAGCYTQTGLIDLAGLTR